eukprot:CAMPEP_0119208438 /NCGR_PEP_ID=MMETSP1327-20130426/639_1 /TAXON_ID=38833 /ORGANISM="Micromonas pusilla, Strain RCC2306" /LENGTH=136 /DNA_ID=CAMNT_0007204957 /DNA_START=34 /DNA_END=441 /DNA_ORIENTATION=-
MAGLHAVTRMHTITACSRRPFEPMRATLHDAREPAALAGFCSRSPRVKPHALRHTKQSIWMDQARRHGRALRETRKPGRWAMTPSSEYVPSEGEAAGTTCVKCGTDTTSFQWYNCKDEPGTKMCKPCYQKKRLDVA